MSLCNFSEDHLEKVGEGGQVDAFDALDTSRGLEEDGVGVADNSVGEVQNEGPGISQSAEVKLSQVRISHESVNDVLSTWR